MATLHYTALRFWSMLKKEFIVIRRDLLTYVFLIFIPFLEVVLFGYIIQTDAKHLPTIVVSHDHSQFTNSLIQSFINTRYFDIYKITNNPMEADKLINAGKVEFVIHIPENFTRDFVRNNKPHILVEGDATDPVAIGNAFQAAKVLPTNALSRDTSGSFNYLSNKGANFVVDTHAKYNPTSNAQYHTLPGLITTILTGALVLLTAISVTSEFEQGTMEMLLITPIKPLEVILGKILPHIVLAYILLILTLILSYFLFNVPFNGNVLLLFFAAFPFIITNLGVGLAASSVSKTQFQAANIANTYYLPALLFSGFMFPFHAMPNWAQWIGYLLPPTHFLHIITNIMLKGAGLMEILPDLWPILLFAIFIIFISFKNYRNTLD